MTNETDTSAHRDTPRTRMSVVFNSPGVMSVRFDQAPTQIQEGR